jgi:DNA-binding helix-hairpin-helix protein with protein kinase domain
MANALYDNAREAFLKGDIDWLNDTIKVVLVDADDYTVDLATHDYLNDVPGAAVVCNVELSTQHVRRSNAGRRHNQ